MMELVTAEEPGDSYAEKLMYDLKFQQEQTPLPDTPDLAVLKIVIIGAGMSGLNMGCG